MSSPAHPVELPLLLRDLRRMPLPRKLGLCERLFGRSISGHGVCWVKTATRASWKLDLENPTHRWIAYGQYEGGAFLEWAREFLPPEGVVVDSSSNIGQMLLYLSEYVPRGRILAFEPCREPADWLEECLKVHPEFSVELLRVRLDEVDKQGFIQSLGTESIHGAWNQISESQGDPIQIVRLDDVVRQRDLETVDLWKLDVEGYELAALRGAETLLERQALRAIYVELAFGNGSQIVDYLGGFGYECFLFDRAGKMDRPDRLPAHTNDLFLPESR